MTGYAYKAAACLSGAVAVCCYAWLGRRAVTARRKTLNDFKRWIGLKSGGVRQGSCVSAPDLVVICRATYTCSSTELIPVLGSQLAGDVSHKPGGRLPSLSARPAVTPTTLQRAATNFAAW